MSCHPILALTSREKEAIALIGKGLSNKEIAKEMKVSYLTVESHIYNALQKLNASNRTQLMLIFDGRLKTNIELIPTATNTSIMLKAKVKELKNQGYSGVTISERLGISSSRIYEIFKELGYPARQYTRKNMSGLSRT